MINKYIRLDDYKICFFQYGQISGIIRKAKVRRCFTKHIFHETIGLEILIEILLLRNSNTNYKILTKEKKLVPEMPTLRARLRQGKPEQMRFSCLKFWFESMITFGQF